MTWTLPKVNIRRCATPVWWCWGIQESVSILLACDLWQCNCHQWLISKGEKWSPGRVIMASLALGLLTSELALSFNINSVKTIKNSGNEKFEGFYELQFIIFKQKCTHTQIHTLLQEDLSYKISRNCWNLSLHLHNSLVFCFSFKPERNASNWRGHRKKQKKYHLHKQLFWLSWSFL